VFLGLANPFNLILSKTTYSNKNYAKLTHNLLALNLAALGAFVF
jgi:hypothetical protein